MSRFALALAVFALTATGCARPSVAPASASTSSSASAAAPAPVGPRTPPPPVGERLSLSPSEWKSRLSSERYEVLREKGTERAFSGAYWNEKREGTYVCGGCGAPLYSSEHKFESGTGWPSYTQAVEAGRVLERPDTSYGMSRVEIVCARCGGHLGHVFDDGPAPTGKRHCVNSASLAFHPDE